MVLTNLRDKVVYHSDINFIADSKDLILFDEADEFIYSEPLLFQTFIQKKRIICLTATCGGATQEAAERSLL